MSGAMDETNFLFARQAIYMSFSALASALALLGASPLRGGLSSLLPAVTSTVGLCPSIFIIIRYYQISINIT